jgi:hypothetical protein
MQGTMSGPPGRLPAQSEARALHARLVAGSRTASSDLAVSYLDYLATTLARLNPKLDPADCDTAAEEALLALIRTPLSYDPERMPLDRYLLMSAQHDLKNLWRAEQRHRRRRIGLDPVELSPRMREHIQDMDSDPARIVEQRESLAEARRAQAEAMAAASREPLTREETACLDLMQQGERRTARFAEALGIGHLPPKDQRAIVYRMKDKLKHRLKRTGERHGRPDR